MAIVKMKSIEELFDEKFFVPSYQRGYRWTEVQIRELLEDLYDFSVSKQESDYYCLQPIIVKKRNDESWELVDGQQRLTALWLISALYYCSNKEDVVDLERKQYSMTYDEKKTFTDLFTTINLLVEENTLKTLVEKLDPYASECIDGRKLIESISYISKYTRNKKTAKGVLGTIFENIDAVKVIWYVLDENEDSIQTFTNINANKIELTNAELIKAILLNNVDDELELQNIALQWEEIEKGLYNNEFWSYMISEKNKKYPTRIDYMFEIFCDKHGLLTENVEQDRYSIFRAVSGFLENNSATVLWMEIQDIYDTLKDWFADYFFYHSIGLLIIVNRDNDASIIDRLYTEYSTEDKTEFRKSVIEQIKKVYFSDKKSTPFSSIFDEEAIHNELENITVQEPEKVRNILLLYNIALLVNANNTYERFPFELYKKGTWDIEHVNPQNPKNSSDDEKLRWLLSYKKVIQNVELKNEIDKCIAKNFDDFEALADEILNELKIVDNDSISNLVLLSAAINRGYKNDCFSEKRKKIIEIERTKNNDEKYIPIGTKWVFLKGYESANQLVAWEPNDMSDYVDDIASKIYTMLGGKNNE